MQIIVLRNTPGFITRLKGDYRRPPIIIFMRDLNALMGKIFQELGGIKKVASICLVTEANAYRWQQPLNKNGETIPVKHLQTILSESKKYLENITLQALVNELLQDHFAGLCLRRVILEDVLSEALFLLSNGCKPAGRISA